ncbi:hypothetical protein chiPu_0028595, partial [Chiloscyllium punctatum]|nr:hypothetical protein [Chiloscyllium punctatum]
GHQSPVQVPGAPIQDGGEVGKGAGELGCQEGPGLHPKLVVGALELVAGETLVVAAGVAGAEPHQLGLGASQHLCGAARFGLEEQVPSPVVGDGRGGGPCQLGRRAVEPAGERAPAGAEGVPVHQRDGQPLGGVAEVPVPAEGAGPVGRAPGVDVDDKGALGPQGHHVVAQPRQPGPRHEAGVAALAGAAGGAGAQGLLAEEAEQEEAAPFQRPGCHLGHR